jgi:hypothetical protein
MMIWKVLVVLALVGVAVGGCATKPTVGSVAGGDCKLVHTPQYAIKGATDYDQEWSDDVTEALVRGCKQSRPKARPAALDAPPPVVTPAVPPAAPAGPPKKLHWWQKLLPKKKT